MTDYDKGLLKIQELAPEVQPVAFMWFEECWETGRPFRISEAYRSQKRQNALYAQGRTAPGPIVTWTRSSNHTRRLAVDIYPIPHPSYTAYKAIEEVASKFGISHPFSIDLPHFEFTEVDLEPFPRGEPKPEARLKGLQRRLANCTNPDAKVLIENIIGRLIKRISSPHTV